MCVCVCICSRRSKGQQIVYDTPVSPTNCTYSTMPYAKCWCDHNATCQMLACFVHLAVETLVFFQRQGARNRAVMEYTMMLHPWPILQAKEKTRQYLENSSSRNCFHPLSTVQFTNISL